MGLAQPGDRVNGEQGEPFHKTVGKWNFSSMIGALGGEKREDLVIAQTRLFFPLTRAGGKKKKLIRNKTGGHASHAEFPLGGGRAMLFVFSHKRET